MSGYIFILRSIKMSVPQTLISCADEPTPQRKSKSKRNNILFFIIYVGVKSSKNSPEILN
jgi:hypothetical protein